MTTAPELARGRPMTNGKREPVEWMGPTHGSRHTSRGKGQWQVIDSCGHRIASGFETRAYALRWIDGFNLMRAGHQLSDDDHKWIFSHWHSALPARQDPEVHAPTESSSNATSRPLPLEDNSGDRRRGGRRILPQQIQAPVTHRTWCHEARQHREGETGRGAGMSLSPATAQKTSRRTVSQDAD